MLNSSPPTATSQNFGKALVPILVLLTMSCSQAPIEYDSLDDYPVYHGDDLGVNYTPQKTVFRLWSPTAARVKVNLYDKGLGGEPLEEHPLRRDEAGTWTGELNGDQKGRYFTFQVDVGTKWLGETPGPYARAVGVNGLRGYILDLDETNPDGWEEDKKPPLGNPKDIIVYEIHVRDMTIHSSSGVRNRGKFLGLTETGTRSPEGLKTGLDHLEELGITHVHVLPMFDFRSIDETRLDEEQYNWGYEPLNYNAPEGSFSTDPYNPATRITELKAMVKALHDKGIRVVMDVVYNHTGFGDAGQYAFSLSTPKYYYRYNEDGSLSDASACGNETASERPMTRKFIIESVRYWAEEYHLDGFRFDLMGIHDIETMNQVRAELHKIDPTIFIYGEGWKAGPSPLPDEKLALKANMSRISNVAAFSDEIRDGLKGSWHDWEEPGFVSGNIKRKEGVKFGIVGGINHDQIDYSLVKESTAAWAAEPTQCMVYVSCHDNHTLYDKLKITDPDASEEEILKMHVLANTIVLTSQGIPFLHAGVDFVRTKQGVENSFESPDSINQIDWTRKAKYQDLHQFYKSLIQLRKNHPAFRMLTKEQVKEHLRFYETKADQNMIWYSISGNANGDRWKDIMVILNGEDAEVELALPSGSWTSVVQGMEVKEEGLRHFETGKISVDSHTAIILVDSSSL